jgi:hypothetical protein
MYVGLQVTCLLFLSDFNKIWIFSKHFRKNTQTSNLMNICSVGAQLFRAEWHDMKLIVDFPNFGHACTSCVTTIFYCTIPAIYWSSRVLTSLYYSCHLLCTTRNKRTLLLRIRAACKQFPSDICIVSYNCSADTKGAPKREGGGGGSPPQNPKTEI